jgi:Fe-S-cluster-containing dehydrogenase component
MSLKCPGQDSRNLRAAMVTCPNCGADVEMFSDELRIRCHICKTFVHKENTPSCVDWCPSAEECVGPERWNALRNAKADSDKEDT